MTTATPAALPQADSVVFQLGRVRRGRLAVRLVHAGLFASGGAASLLGAAMSAGYEPNDGRVVALVFLGALAAAAIYLGDTARGADNLAAELDRGLQREGALLTAWQAERREPEAPFTRLLAQREAAQLRGARALRCCTPHWALAVIVPLLLFAWCASVAADEEPAPPGVTSQQRMERAANALQGAAQAARERAAAPAAQADPGAQRAQRAAELQRMAARAKRPRAGTSPAAAGELRRDIAEQLARGGWNAQERLGLEQALDSLEGLRRDAGEESGATPDESSTSGAAEVAYSSSANDPGPDSSATPSLDPSAPEPAGGAAGSAATANPSGEPQGGPGAAAGGAGAEGPAGAVEPGASPESASDPAPEAGAVQRRRRRARGAEVQLLQALEPLEGWSGRVPSGSDDS